MSKLSLFNSPLLLGFDQIERMLDSIAKAPVDGYPPYNVEQVGGDALRITLAVAGFTRDDLAVGVEGNQLIIRGKQPEEAESRVYLHRGIAARQFQRRFLLAEGIEVTGATMRDGLLHVELRRPLPATRSRRIEIQSEARTTPADAIDVDAGNS